MSATLLEKYSITIFLNGFVLLFRKALTDCISLFATAKKKIVTWLTKQTKTKQANAGGNNKLLDNSSLAVVNSEHDIAFWVNPMRSLAQDHQMTLFGYHR